MKKRIIGFLSGMFPNFFVRLAYQKLTNPQVRNLRATELEVLKKAKQEVFPFRNFSIQTYAWLGGSKKILLIHGWEGQAGNFSFLIEALLAKGYTVHAFDGPSHGFSSKGETSLFEFAALVDELVRHYQIAHLVSHSFGSVATTYALSNNPALKIEKYVLLTSPDKFSERINYVIQQVGLSKKVEIRLIERIEKELQMKVHELNVSTFIKSANVASALIIHDKHDKVIPIQQSRSVQSEWKNCRLEEVEGTGHFKVLTTDWVINKIIAFME
ncbi:MAG: alpha/beta hydrolase [Saprospiraceae bacterium]|nr:alpha/beta hydrolase [Saprospiraceae bacterium]